MTVDKIKYYHSVRHKDICKYITVIIEAEYKSELEPRIKIHLYRRGNLESLLHLGNFDKQQKLRWQKMAIGEIDIWGKTWKIVVGNLRKLSAINNGAVIFTQDNIIPFRDFSPEKNGEIVFQKDWSCFLHLCQNI